MSKKISELDAVDSLDGSELVPVVQGGQNKSATTSQIGVNLYNADGSLTGDRKIDIGQHDISFKNSTYTSGLLYVEGDDSSAFVGVGDWDENVNGVYIRVDDAQKEIIIASASDGTGTIEMRGKATINGTADTLFNVKDPDSGVVYLNVKGASNGIVFQNSSGIKMSLDDDIGGIGFTGDTYILDLAGGGVTGLSIDDNGKIIRTP